MEWTELKNTLIEYLKRNPKSSIRAISVGTGFESIKILKAMNELGDEGKVVLTVLPFGNSIDPDNSSFYSAR